MSCRPTPPSEPLRVFISYARKDGAALAQRLQFDLAKEGFDAWLDTQRIAGGRVRSAEIEDRHRPGVYAGAAQRP
jgi:TIR domain